MVSVSLNLSLHYTTYIKEVSDLISRKDWNLQSSTYPALSWYGLQGMLEIAGFDVLLILDCCCAAGAITKGPGGTMEVLAGCSRESNAGGPGSSSAIGSPFTHTLIKHLEESATQPHGLLMTELQALLSFDKVLENQSPIHVLLAGHHNPIKLRPLLSEAELKAIESSTSQTVKSELKALLAISFQGNVLPKMEEFVQWLNSQYPKEVAKVEVEKVSIEGSFDSGSTLMLLSMPISVWAHLDGSHGSSFVGFVKSRNLLTNKSKLRMTREEREKAWETREMVEEAREMVEEARGTQSEMAKMVSMMRETREMVEEAKGTQSVAKMVSMMREEREKAWETREMVEEARGTQSEMAKMVSMMREEREKAREMVEEARGTQSEMAKMVSMMREERDKAREERDKAREKGED